MKQPDLEPETPVGLLACKDATARRDGSLALAKAGLRVAAAATAAETHALVDTLRPSVIVVDAALLACESLRAALESGPGSLTVPVLALCRRRDVALRALEHGATDVVEGPIDWRIVSRRALLLESGSRAARELARHQSLLRAKESAGTTYDAADGRETIDRVTRLPERRRFEHLLERALPHGPVAVLYLGLDRFATVNGVLGRRGGDAVLQQVAERLVLCLRDARLLGERKAGMTLQVAARLSGDEFALLLTDVADTELLSRFAREVLAALSGVFAVEGSEVFLSATMGIAVTAGEAKGAEKLVHEAEAAMHEAKRRGGGSFAFYGEASSGAPEREQGMACHLRKAFDGDQLSLAFQPVVESGSGRVVAAEALLRWRSPSLGSVPPGTFIPVAEETGLMAPIGGWVLRTACVQLSRWIEEGLPSIRMAVNVSLCQFQRGDFAEQVGAVLRETGIPPGLLELELSERGALRSEPDVLKQLERLKALGVRLLADDFGTGQSAIGYLKQFPLDGLKIDRSFVRGVTDSKDDAAIVSAIIAMAHRLNLGVIAEGVETQRQLEVLREYRCEEIQGFLFSVPLPAPEFRQWWRDRLDPSSSPWPEAAKAAAQPMAAANLLH